MGWYRCPALRGCLGHGGMESQARWVLVWTEPLEQPPTCRSSSSCLARSQEARKSMSAPAMGSW